MGIQSLPANAGTSKIRKRIRDLERLLKKPGLAATKKSEAERAVAVFKAELDTAQHRKSEIKTARKYHMVKFVEKKKALRALKKDGAGDEQLAAWYYITQYPKDKKYRALYANEAAQKATPETHWFLRDVHERMASGELKSGPEAVQEIITTASL